MINLFNALIQETIAKFNDKLDVEVDAFNVTSPCGTEDGKKCIFPFFYSGKTYDTCTTHYSHSNKASVLFCSVTSMYINLHNAT